MLIHLLLLFLLQQTCSSSFVFHNHKYNTYMATFCNRCRTTFLYNSIKTETENIRVVSDDDDDDDTVTTKTSLSTDKPEQRNNYINVHDGKWWYRRADGNWRVRTDLSDLKVGQRVFGSKIDTDNYLDGKTGAKIFFDCGVVRKNKKTGKFVVVNGMLRVTNYKMKAGIIRKRVAKIKKKGHKEFENGDKYNMIPLYVSRVSVSTGRFEVVSSKEELDYDLHRRRKIVSASSLQIGQEVRGKVVKVTDYGVFVDVQASRTGLLHITKVSALSGQFINKSEGLVKFGLEKGAEVKLCVLSNERKRLALDFTSDVKEEAEKEKQQHQLKMKMSGEKKKNTDDDDDQKASEQIIEGVKIVTDRPSSEDEEAAMWAAYAGYSADDDEEEEEEEDDDDYYDEEDEDRDIEGKLGLDFY